MANRERRECCGGERGKVHKDGCPKAARLRSRGARTESDLVIAGPKPLSKAAVKRIREAATYDHRTSCYDGPGGSLRMGFYSLMRQEDIAALCAHAGVTI